MSHIYRKTVIAFLFLACLTGAAASAQTESGAPLWLPTKDGDLVAESLAAPLGLKAASVPRENVTYSRAMVAADEASLDLKASSLSAESKEYWVQVTAAELERGVAILTDAPGALVRINPAPGQKALLPIDPAALILSDPAGKAWSAGSGMELLASADKLRAAGAPFVEGTAAFRIRADLGAGAFDLRAEGLVSEGTYVLQVFDHASPIALRLTTEQTDYLHGQDLRLQATWTGVEISKARFDGYVTSPAGRAWPLTFERLATGAFAASLELDGLEAPAPGLWEAHIASHSATKAGALMRSVRVPFQVAVAAARFDGSVTRADGADLTLSFGVEAVSASRYEVRGILYGTSDDGEMLPAALAHSAAWLEPGHGTVDLVFERAHLEASGLKAPYEIRDLRLMDQGTMGLLHRQLRGLVLGK